MLIGLRVSDPVPSVYPDFGSAWQRRRTAPARSGDPLEAGAVTRPPSLLRRYLTVSTLPKPLWPAANLALATDTAFHLYLPVSAMATDCEYWVPETFAE